MFEPAGFQRQANSILSQVETLSSQWTSLKEKLINAEKKIQCLETKLAQTSKQRDTLLSTLDKLVGEDLIDTQDSDTPVDFILSCQVTSGLNNANKCTIQCKDNVSNDRLLDGKLAESFRDKEFNSYISETLARNSSSTFHGQQKFDDEVKDIAFSNHDEKENSSTSVPRFASLKSDDQCDYLSKDVSQHVESENTFQKLTQSDILFESQAISFENSCTNTQEISLTSLEIKSSYDVRSDGNLYRTQSEQGTSSQNLKIETRSQKNVRELVLKNYRKCLTWDEPHHKEKTLDEHIKKEHLISKPKNFCCPNLEDKCNSHFQEKTSSIQPVNAHHRKKSQAISRSQFFPKRKSWECSICDVKFSHPHILAKHIKRIHGMARSTLRCVNRGFISQTFSLKHAKNRRIKKIKQNSSPISTIHRTQSIGQRNRLKSKSFDADYVSPTNNQTIGGKIQPDAIINLQSTEQKSDNSTTKNDINTDIPIHCSLSPTKNEASGSVEGKESNLDLNQFGMKQQSCKNAENVNLSMKKDEQMKCSTHCYNLRKKIENVETKLRIKTHDSIGTSKRKSKRKNSDPLNLKKKNEKKKKQKRVSTFITTCSRTRPKPFPYNFRRLKKL